MEVLFEIIKVTGRFRYVIGTYNLGKAINDRWGPTTRVIVVDQTEKGRRIIERRLIRDDELAEALHEARKMNDFYNQATGRKESLD